MPFEFKLHKLEDVVATVLSEVSELRQEKSLDLKMVSPVVGTMAALDDAKMIQVVRNRLSNAIKFSPDGKSIRISYDETRLPVARSSSDGESIPALRLLVSDEGVGIPEGELESVFDKFVQSSKTRTGAGGTGLGLAICKEIVEGHGGIIRAEHNPVGGAVFTVFLPRSQSVAMDSIGFADLG